MLKAFNQFLQCRAGDNFKPFSTEKNQITKLFKLKKHKCKKDKTTLQFGNRSHLISEWFLDLTMKFKEIILGKLKK